MCGKLVDDKKWQGIVTRISHLENIFDLGINRENSRLTIRIDGKAAPLTP